MTDDTTPATRSVQHKRRWPWAVGTGVLTAALTLSMTPATAAVADLFDLGRGATLTSPDGSVYTVSVEDDGDLVTTLKQKPTPTATPKPTSSATPTPTSTAPALDVKATASGAGTISVSWPRELQQATFGRDGVDAGGTGAWTSDQGATSPQQLTNLKPGTRYTVTVAGVLGGRQVSRSVSVTTGTAGTPTAAPTSSAPTPSAPAPRGQDDFNATTLGASVTGAANGDFNRWTGTKLGLYATWADNGKVWGIDTPGSEYGRDSVARLGDYDLDIATQHRIANWANPGIDANLEATFREIKSKWGDRKGHVYVRPFHEMNGNWYNWSVRNPSDAANFVKYWRTVVHPKWTSVMGDDDRFHLVWSPNRDTSTSVDVRTMFPGAQYVDAIGVDYYDFSRADDDAKWAAEVDKTQNGGPVGIGAWDAFAQSQGVPWYLPEYGVQFGDNSVFATKVLDFVKANRYSGEGDASGKALGAAWHNLQGSSPDPNAGGDFFVQRGGKDYAGRAKTATAVRSWVQTNTWLRQAK
ncbi:glycosyl hydrolase [Kineococcus rhizosphaerae]|uniref:Glycosyl hydrolase family 26 n=1 Tax=Kineococcus rhizosphaerae TaxID=559628 RepID=A0A2T0R9U0_9ACTN|nr:glycosyl hydrolase [Kineococcus rhizosphaerae]PRY17924.1 glycosyl hydrolase family 26 [Kineococcus rhizosphaerae]